jgi:hypothetical protein
MKIPCKLMSLRLEWKDSRTVRLAIALEQVPSSCVGLLLGLEQGPVTLELLPPQARLPGLEELQVTNVPEAFR